MAESRIDVSIEQKQASAQAPAEHPNTCPSCGSHYRGEELERHLGVCPQCGHHFPVGARERIAQLVDPGTFGEEDTDLHSGDALGSGTGAIEGTACALAVMDFAFMGGSMGSVVGEKFARTCDRAIEHG